MPFEGSANSLPSFSEGLHGCLEVPRSNDPLRPAYIPSSSHTSSSPNSRSSFSRLQIASPLFVSQTSGNLSGVNHGTSPNSGSTSHSPAHGYYEERDDLPPSSTPDLLSPDALSSASPEIPLAQQSFTNRLHALLQAVQDEQCNEQDSSVDDSSCQAFQGEDDELLMVSSPGRIEIQREISWKNNFNGDVDENCGTSDISSEDSWALSPQNGCSRLEGVYATTPLTHRNKRKHDSSHGFSGSSDPTSDEDTTDVDNWDEDPFPDRKKPKVGRGSTASISTSFSYQTNETASSRKLRSLSSATSSFSSADSTVVNRPSLIHPIIHPPSNPPHVPKSRPEVAKARVKLLLKREASYRIQDGLPAGLLNPPDFRSDEHETIFGIEPEFRRRVVKWILDILPPRYLNSYDLHQHLKHSEETRFHAMYLFSRFFLRTAERGERRGKLETKSMKSARREITWDVAFCCLALSIKFYHDFLYPLNPIYSRHFLAMSPQILSHDQFERIQRDVLEAFDYEVHGVTPHAFFEELWDASPSLRDILRFRRTRTNIRDEMWDVLQLAALECDIMLFPVSVLTAAALIESILITLVFEYGKEEDRSGHNGTDSRADRLRKNCSKAREDIRPVSEEISGLLGAAVADLDTCRHWLAVITSE